MERNANYALVGFASLMLFVGMVVFIVWLARIQFAHVYDTYDIIFDGPVNGLSQGGEVHFNGIKVGDVTQIGLDKVDPKKVVARVRVTNDVPIRADSYATLEPEGITGVNYVQITPGSTTRPLLKDMPHSGKYPVLSSRPSALTNLLAGGGTLMQSAVETLSRINRVLSDDNIQSFDVTLHDVQAVADEAKKRKQLFADADKAVNDIDSTADSIKKFADNGNDMLNGDGKKTLKNAADAAEQIRAAATDARALLAKLQGPTTDFATNGLPRLTAAVGSLQQTADTLNRLANELEASPQALISKTPPKEVEVKP